MLVVGDRTTLKVHVHTDDPERATALFDGAGEVSHLDVADMREQVAAAQPSASAASREPALRRRSRSSAGAGMRELFEGARRRARSTAARR